MTPPFEGCDPGRYLEDGERSAPESTPHLVVDLPTVRDNVARVLEVAGGPDGWRPHLKTSKLPEVWTLLLEQGLHRFKCATVLELSELLSIAPEADCVLAHHPDDAACGALGALARAHPRARIACLVEEPADLDRVPGEVGLFVDVDPGMHRSGLDPRRREPIIELVRQAGSRCRGIHFYDGGVCGARPE